MYRSLAAAMALVVASALLPPAALAQEQTPPTIFMTSWMCDRDAMDDLVEAAEARDLPIMQELVDEGLLHSYALLVHGWGDEWNYITVMMADDVPAGLAANDEANERFEARHGEDADFVRRCPAHRDQIYVGAFTTDAAPAPRDTPYAVAMSYYACPLDEINGVVETARQHFVPAARASAQAGMGYWASGIRHAWADEWTYIIVRAAEDIPSLLAFIEDTGERMGPDNPGAGPPSRTCRAHKDNIYWMAAQTRPRAE